MVAVYIDPLVCHTWLGYLLPECYGIAVMSGTVIGALVLAYGYRKAINFVWEPTRLDLLRRAGIR